MSVGKVKSSEKIQDAPEQSSAARARARQLDTDATQPTFNGAPSPQAAGNLAVQRLFRAGAIQAKLRISQSGDADEQEADRIAERVVAAKPTAAIQRKCAACVSGTTCPKCEEERQLQPKTKPGQRAQADSQATSQIAPLRGGGHPLPSFVRDFFEPRFRWDFSRVRIHTDGAAAESAHAINARAYTSGQDVVFGAGEYSPASAEGQLLLAHELAHVTQQAQSDASPHIQRRPRKEPKETKAPVNWQPGMFAKVVKDRIPIDPPRYDQTSYKIGEILEVTSEVAHFYKSPSVLTVLAPLPGRPRGTMPLYVNINMIEPVDASQLPKAEPEQQQVKFQVDVLSAADFARTTGIDPAALPEGSMIPLNQARLIANPMQDQWVGGAAPGVGFGWAQSPWPAFPVPANATGVQWTQSAFGHFSQFANVPGDPVIGGYRSYAVVHGYQGIHSTLSGRPWTAPVPGGYFNDWWFRLMSPQSQTLIYREGTPQHADLVSRLIKQGQYTEPYTFPPSPSGTRCTNCITVPKVQEYGALGGKPVIVTETGVYDITKFGRPSAAEPFTAEQAGRGTTMREWLTKPTVQTPTGEIETLNVARVPPSTVWSGRGVACIRAGGIVLLLYGAYRTTERLEEAADKPYFHRVVAQEAGSWIGGIIGGALGAAAAGAIACSPSGPGAFVCAAAGFVGGLVVGAAGSMLGAMGGDYLARELEGTLETAGEVFNPIIERWIWGDKPIPAMGYYPPREFGRDPGEYEEAKEDYLKSLGRR